MTARRRPIAFLAGAAALAVGPLALAACGGGGATASTTPPKASTATALGTGSSGLGTILVDSRGRTLYLFKKDSGTASTCTGACATAWPPLVASGAPTAAGGAHASLLGTTKRADGTSQVTYNGHPLYLFVNDVKPGQTNGQGLTAFGAAWFAVTPAGNQVGSSPAAGSAAKQPAAPAPKPAPEAAAPKPAPEAPAPKPAPEPAPKPAPPAEPKPAPPAAGGIPQNNGGDGDADNNGGPSDGDGEV